MTRATFQQGHDPAYMADPDPRSKPIPYVMTNRDRDEAKIYTLQAEQNRRRQNAEDDARAAAKALESEDWT